MTVMRNLLQALALSGVALASTLTTYGRYPNISVDHPPWREKFLGELAYFREQLVRDIQKFRISKRVTGTLFQSQFNVEIWEHPAVRNRNTLGFLPLICSANQLASASTLIVGFTGLRAEMKFTKFRVTRIKNITLSSCLRIARIISKKSIFTLMPSIAASYIPSACSMAIG